VPNASLNIVLPAIPSPAVDPAPEVPAHNDMEEAGDDDSDAEMVDAEPAVNNQEERASRIAAITRRAEQQLPQQPDVTQIAALIPNNRDNLSILQATQARLTASSSQSDLHPTAKRQRICKPVASLQSLCYECLIGMPFHHVKVKR
jgi:hypothetical protein